ncbi:MAG: Rieske 2Fe-2S domain-containing protein [Cycloclasticus sp.]|nr:Rieske 2Fe-2S domain-containing protein [Cycloclasticus sp.]
MEIIEVDGDKYVQAVEVETLACLSSRAFEVDLGDNRGACSGFLLREKDMTLRAYKNSCPHTGAPLNWTPDQFLTRAGLYIQCSIHGAMFKTQNGECFAGPCTGKFLKALRFIEKDGMSYIALLDIEKSPSI